MVTFGREVAAAAVAAVASPAPMESQKMIAGMSGNQFLNRDMLRHIEYVDRIVGRMF